MKNDSKKRSNHKATKIGFVVLLIGSSITTWWASYRSGLSIIYNDAMSHLNIARAVFDGKQTGLAQLGSVWLPLNHILFLTLIWNNWAWHSGFAGSLFSMLAYICSVIGIYLIVNELTDNFWASILGGLTFAVNPNILYLQTTPLTEPLYLAFFIFSVFFIVKFMKTNELKWLLLMGIFGMFQILTRYDGWFVVGIEGLALIYQQLFIVKVRFQELWGKFILFSMPIIFGVVLWILWNALIFGDPLYFLLGPYSAHAQQTVIQNAGGLITKGNMRISLLAYWYAARDNVGFYLIVLASFGVALLLTAKTKLGSLKDNWAVLLVLLAPIIFNIIALYLGFSILNIPELHWNPVADSSGQWFNVRYGIMALPIVAVSLGILVAKVTKKILRPIAISLIAVIVIVQALVTCQQGIITITDGVMGSSNNKSYVDIANVLAKNVIPNQNVLISTFSYSSVMFRSGFPLKDFITEGDSAEWKSALADPQDYADWVVMGNGDPNDAVYEYIFKNNYAEFLKNYISVHCDVSICVYRKRTPGEIFVSTDGTNLNVGETQLTINGVNDYDLAYQTPAEIDASLKNLQEIGVNTVRFWLFGDGNPNGFQVTSGIMNESRLENTDYLIADAAQYHIRLIPVLLNNWTDYGGMAQYLEWIGKDPTDENAFYTDPEAIALFENYINHIIPRTNTITGVPYSDDPTILAWEIINEPTPTASDTTAFSQWFSTIAAYIRREDPNHLITVDTEPGYVDAHGNSHITDYCGSLPVDICSAHFYLYDNNQIVYSTIQDAEAALNEDAQFAQKANKPFFVGELGVSKETTPFDQSPLAILGTLAKSQSSRGVLIWNWSYKPDTSFGFSPDGTNGTYNLQDLSGVLGGPSTVTVYAPSILTQTGYDFSIPGVTTITKPAPTSTILIAVNSSSLPITVPVTITVPIPTPTSTILATPPLESTSTPPVVTVATTTITLPYQSSGFTLSEWNNGWGTISANPYRLEISSDVDDTSAAAFLNGGNTWQDYLLTADVNWVKGQLFAVDIHYTDSQNYIECDFTENGDTEININRIFMGMSQSMSSGGTADNFANHISLSDMHISVEVKGDTVQCGVNNAFVENDINGGIDPVLLHGGIGFKGWDPEAGNSEIVIKNVSITPLP